MSSRSVATMLLASLPFIPAAAYAQTAGTSTVNTQVAAAGTASATSLPETVVTATRTETPIEEVASSITVITAEEISEKQNRTVVDALRSVPGITIVGNRGAATSVRIRGMKAEDTVILIDGVPTADPSGFGGYDMTYMSTDNVERIEVLRGPQGTLYGANGAGGVINIITKKGSGDPTGFIAAEAGSYNTFRERAGMSGGNQFFNASIGASRTDSDSFSAASKRAGNREKDGFDNTSFSGRFGITPTDNFSADLIMRYMNDHNETDGGGGPGYDDNTSTDNEQYFLRGQAKLGLFENVWNQTLGVSVSGLYRDYYGGSPIYAPAPPASFLNSQYKGKILKVDWQHDLRLHETNTLTLGAETTEETASSWNAYNTQQKTSIRSNGFYAQDQIRLWDAWFTTLGIRVDDHDLYSTQTTWRAATAYTFHQTGTTLRAGYGTGFNAPVVSQLYDAKWGNANLKATKTRGWELGLEQSLLNDRLVLGATYFNNDVRDGISWSGPVSTGRYITSPGWKTNGLEFIIKAEIIDGLTVNANYTRTITEDKTPTRIHQSLQRTPGNTGGVNVNYRFLDNKANVNLGLNYVGKRWDQYWATGAFTAENVNMGQYALVNVAASYDVTDGVQVFGRLDNLLNKKYENVYGYGTSGLAGYGGIKLSF